MLNLSRGVVGLVAVLLVALGTIAGCGGDSSTPTAPSPTPVTITGIAVSPLGGGIESSTAFTFTVEGVSGPATYSWTSSDGQTVPSDTGTVTNFIYERAGVFDMRVTVTNALGVSASAVTTVTITNLTGSWMVFCSHYDFLSDMPERFIVDLTQYTDGTGTRLSGSMTGYYWSEGVYRWTRSFTNPGRVYDDVGSSLPPKTFRFGVESADNPWGSHAEDLYFTLTLDPLSPGTAIPLGATAPFDINLCPGPPRVFASFNF